MKVMLSNEALNRVQQPKGMSNTEGQFHGPRSIDSAVKRAYSSKLHVNTIPLIVKNAEARNLDSLIQSFNNRVKDREAFKQFFEMSKNQRISRSTEDKYLIQKKKAPKHKSYLPPVIRTLESIEQFPKTNQCILRSPSFIPVSPFTKERIGDNTPLELIQKLQRAEFERLSNKEAHSKVVYDIYDSIELPYSELCAGKRIVRQSLNRKCLPLHNNNDTLIFESRFESGNLRRAIQV